MKYPAQIQAATVSQMSVRGPRSLDCGGLCGTLSLAPIRSSSLNV